MFSKNHILGKKINLIIICAVVSTFVQQVQADVALKFFGRAAANDLTPEIKEAVADTEVDVDGFLCFELPLFDLSSGRQVGVGVDCLNPFNGDGDEAGDGIQLEAKTFFFLQRGTIVNHGCTSVRPFFAGVGDAGVTHMSGSIPPAEFSVEPDEDAPPLCTAVGGIIYTDGGFKNSEGATRLSGAVNLSELDQGVMTFSCAFVIALDPPRNATGLRKRNR